MANLATLSARQRKAGEAIQMSGQFLSPTHADYADWDDYGLGVTTTGTAPTTVGDLVAAPLSGDGIGRSTFADHRSRLDGTLTSHVYRDQWHKRQALDSTFVVGRYVWAIFLGAGSGGSQPIIAHSGSYHIS